MPSKFVSRILVIVVVIAVAFFLGRKYLQDDEGIPAGQGNEIPLRVFFDLRNSTAEKATAARKLIGSDWRPGYAIMLVEQMKFAKTPYPIARLLKQHVPKYADFENWSVGIWNADYEPHSKYAEFKSEVYSHIDPRFAEYFDSNVPTSIRLDEVIWGGVKRDGIPPLDKPTMISVAEADYLADSDVVFGIEINGDARAYPKRILAWHEMFKDKIGGKSVNGVYCTLCSSMILYQTVCDGVHHELGTSGFLYRSNKLMYDHETKSMWSTIEGKPVVGSLVGKGIVLDALPVVTTNWGEWKNAHPATTVLSLETGHKRDYGEGVAYADYFASPYLMFDVPEIDERLAIKDEVLAIRHSDSGEDTLAIAVDFLTNTPVYSDTINGTQLVVFTSPSGANRVYESTGVKFAEWDGKNGAKDVKGNLWAVGEDAVVNDALKERRARIPAHRSFWFGWYAMHPETRLVQ